MKIIINKNGIKKSSLFKYIFVGFFLGVTPFIILLGILAAFGFNTFSINGEQLHGVNAIVGSILLAPFLSLTWVFMLWLHTVIGLWLYRKFKQIEFVNESNK